MTLIELLVAIAVFSIVILIFLLTFVSATTAQRKLRNMREVNEAARFVMEKISRDVEYANGSKDGAFGYSLATSGDGIFIYNTLDNGTICTKHYYLSGSSDKNKAVWFGNNCWSNPSDVALTDITGKKVYVKTLKFSQDSRLDLNATPPTKDLLTVQIEALSAEALNRRGAGANISLTSRATMRSLDFLK